MKETESFESMLDPYYDVKSKSKPSIVSQSDFKKLNLCIGKVLSAERVSGTENLIKLQINVGDSVRQIVAGMAKFYDPDYFVGKNLLILLNIQPQKFKDVLSNGMILAADIEGKPILLQPEKDVPPGTIVR